MDMRLGQFYNKSMYNKISLIWKYNNKTVPYIKNLRFVSLIYRNYLKDTPISEPTVLYFDKDSNTDDDHSTSQEENLTADSTPASPFRKYIKKTKTGNIYS